LAKSPQNRYCAQSMNTPKSTPEPDESWESLAEDLFGIEFNSNDDDDPLLLDELDQSLSVSSAPEEPSAASDVGPSAAETGVPSDRFEDSRAESAFDEDDDDDEF